MKFSLVMATIGRTAEVARLLASLDAQVYRNFELVVVDQNPDKRLAPLLARYADRFTVMQLRSQPGLSRARNVGLEKVSGDLVAFPDDDCWYLEDTLQRVCDLFRTHAEWGGIAGRSVDEQGRDAALHWGEKDGALDRFNVWRRAISYTIFLRRSIVEAVGMFDANLGVGAGTIYGSGEETDYLIRAIAAGARIHYAPDVTVHHPRPAMEINAYVLQRAYSYGCGMGRVLVKHRYPLWFRARALLRPLGGAMVSLYRSVPQANFYWHRFAGRARGMSH